MKTTIHDVMAKRVLVARPHHTVAHVRGLMERNRIHAVPVVDVDGRPLGIVTSADLVAERKAESPVNRVMTTDVRTVPAYNDVQVAARIMRRHKIHHVVVTHEKEVVGIVSSLDLLKLIEGHRFVAKPAGSATAKKSPKKGSRAKTANA